MASGYWGLGADSHGGYRPRTRRRGTHRPRYSRNVTFRDVEYRYDDGVTSWRSRSEAETRETSEFSSPSASRDQERTSTSWGRFTSSVRGDKINGDRITTSRKSSQGYSENPSPLFYSKSSSTEFECDLQIETRKEEKPKRPCGNNHGPFDLLAIDTKEDANYDQSVRHHPNRKVKTIPFHHGEHIMINKTEYSHRGRGGRDKARRSRGFARHLNMGEDPPLDWREGLTETNCGK